MNKLLAKKFFIACVLILMGTLAFIGFNGLKENPLPTLNQFCAIYY